MAEAEQIPLPADVPELLSMAVRKMDFINHSLGAMTEQSHFAEEKREGYMKSIARGSIMQGLGQIPIFDGTKKVLFKTWMKSIKKYGKLNSFSDEDYKGVAHLKSEGLVSDMIGRLLEDGNLTFEQLETNLKDKFSETADPHAAYTLLTKTKQQKNENLVLYGERILTLAEDSFPEGTDSPAVQRQIINVFIDGLSDVAIQRKCKKSDNKTFQELPEVAIKES